MSTEETEARASTMGWLPKEKFLERGGSEDRWTDAEAYIRRGEEILPFSKLTTSSYLTALSKPMRRLQSCSSN